MFYMLLLFLCMQQTVNQRRVGSFLKARSCFTLISLVVFSVTYRILGKPNHTILFASTANPDQTASELSCLLFRQARISSDKASNLPKRDVRFILSK